MKKLLILLLVFSVEIFAQRGSDYCSASKILEFERLSKTSEVNYPGDPRFDATYYKLDLFISHNPLFLSGRVTVKGKALDQNLNSIFLDLWTGFSVSSVISNGKDLSFNFSPGNQLNITLDRSYSPSEEFTLEIIYSGRPNSSGGIGGSFVSSNTPYGRPVIWTLSQPYGSRDWWPSKDTPADKADSSEVWITADPLFVSVSNGLLTGVINNPDGTRTYKWKNHYPIANYLISIAMSNYYLYETRFEYEPGKFLPVNHYVYPEVFNSQKVNLDRTIDMLRIFSEKFGPYPYPKEKYGHAQCGFGGGMEHQTIASMGGFGEALVVHELAHQWFGDKVTCRDWANIWLNEGFATYSESIYFEEKYGNTSFMNDVTAIMNHAKTATGTIYVQNTGSVSQIFNGARSYSKGGVVLHMLRGVVGDDNFFRILREYLNEPGLSYGTATTEDFKRIAERVSGTDLDYFFQQWIYGENYPKYVFSWGYEQLAGNNYNLIIRIEQPLTNTNPQFFKMPVQIKYSTSTGTKTITLFNDMKMQSWNIPVIGKPLSVEFDPDNWILKDILESNGMVIIPTRFELFQNYPNPFNNGTNIKYSIISRQNVRLAVYDLLGREIAELVDEQQDPGAYTVSFTINNLAGNGKGLQLSSGIYYYRITAGGFNQTKKMIYLK